MQSIQDDDFDPEECIAKFDLEDCDPSLSSGSSIQEMAQSVAASLTPITAAAPSNAALWAEMNAANTSVQNRIKDLMQSDPILSTFKGKPYGIQVNTTTFRKANEGTSKVFAAIIDHILTQSGAVQTQTEIRSYVAERYPSHSVPKDWTKPLRPWAIKKVKDRIQNSAAPISNIQLPKAATLSQLHNAAAATMERYKNGVLTFRPVVEVSDSSIVINGIAFSIGENKVKGRTYKQVRVSMPELLQALIDK
ncbi:hypothetical protein IHV84_00865 [Acidovorax sp. IB03]|uniref:hypothetical protein n=1 Tax=Acidovorax sp. IB03 TaxID=2779366 RepID=UPI0018E7950C|nr:hypothetical protein [Acidovorax sp. IB03]MBJ2162524.1 hypothetical protein [Acidovorax sp. IB03]